MGSSVSIVEDLSRSNVESKLEIILVFSIIDYNFYLVENEENDSSSVVALSRFCENIVSHSVTGHDNGVNYVACSSDGRFIASGSNDKTAKFNKTGNCLHTITEHTSDI